MHLTPEDFVDLAEGARDEAAVAHLAECAVCRRQLSDARAMMASVGAVEVPEPSPLFWAHFSRRIGAAVAADGQRTPWWPGWLWVPAAALAMVALLTTQGLRVTPPQESNQAAATAPSAPDSLAAAVPGEWLGEFLQDGPSLDLVAGLTDAADVDVGLASRDSAEDAITRLSGAELKELSRLLREELARAGA